MTVEIIGYFSHKCQMTNELVIIIKIIIFTRPPEWYYYSCIDLDFHIDDLSQTTQILAPGFKTEKKS